MVKFADEDIAKAHLESLVFCKHCSIHIKEKIATVNCINPLVNTKLCCVEWAERPCDCTDYTQGMTGKTFLWGKKGNELNSLLDAMPEDKKLISFIDHIKRTIYSDPVGDFVKEWNIARGKILGVKECLPQTQPVQ